MLGILAPNKLFLNSISVFTVYTELETLPICDMKQKLNEIKRSKSWKVTKPFRKIRSLF
jgi:hypothetical protein